MLPPFDEALDNLLAEYYHLKPDELITVLQQTIDKLRDVAQEGPQNG